MHLCAHQSTHIPHFCFCDELTMDRAMSWRQQMRDNITLTHTQDGLTPVPFSLMPLMIKAMSLAAVRYPIVNSSLADDASAIVYHGSHNIGFALDTKNGTIRNTTCTPYNLV